MVRMSKFLVVLCAALLLGGIATADVEWNFDNDLDGWGGPSDAVTNLRWEDGAMVFEWDGAVDPFDPHISPPSQGELGLDGDATQYVVIEAEFTHTGGSSAVTWEILFGDDNLWHGANATFYPNQGKMVRAFHMPTLKAEWTGPLNYFRLDPGVGGDLPGYDGQTCRIHRIAILNDPGDLVYDFETGLQGWGIPGTHQLNAAASGGAMVCTFPDPGEEEWDAYIHPPLNVVINPETRHYMRLDIEIVNPGIDEELWVNSIWHYGHQFLAASNVGVKTYVIDLTTSAWAPEGSFPNDFNGWWRLDLGEPQDPNNTYAEFQDAEVRIHYVAWTDGQQDADNDGLPDADETIDGIHGTDPGNPDTDGDGMHDGYEVTYGLDPLLDDADEDPDGDGFTNGEEADYGSNPFDPESYPIAMPAATHLGLALMLMALGLAGMFACMKGMRAKA
jgi:hypothetical protein